MRTASKSNTKTGKEDLLNYWIFQANPRTGDDLHEFLQKNGRSGWWRVTRPFKDPRQHLRPGDKVALWQVEGNRPDAAGLYGIGEITKPPTKVEAVKRGEVGFG
jgi:hypothetical protein